MPVRSTVRKARGNLAIYSTLDGATAAAKDAANINGEPYSVVKVDIFHYMVFATDALDPKWEETIAATVHPTVHLKANREAAALLAERQSK